MYKSSYHVETPFVTHVIHPVKEHKKTMIFFHGLGNLTSRFANILTSMQSPVDFNTKIILIQATISGYGQKAKYKNPHKPIPFWYDEESKKFIDGEKYIYGFVEEVFLKH